MSLIWPLPKVSFKSLREIQEDRPVALITSEEEWARLGDALDLPLVVQAEPSEANYSYLRRLADSMPRQARVVYAVGSGLAVTTAKLVAHQNNLPLVIVPDSLESDALVEAHVVVPSEGLLNRIETGPAQEVIIDWDVIQSAPLEERAAAIVDVLAIVTALLDWRYAARQGKNRPDQRFSAWGAGVAASLASQAIKSAKAIGSGEVEALRTLLDLVMMSVQLAGQLGHDRHQEGTEHYFAFSMENQGVTATHAELVGAGILFTSALHGQNPGSLRDALLNAGINVDRLQASDIRLAINDLPAFVAANDLPFSQAHDLDPLSEEVAQTLEKAGILHDSASPAAEDTPPAADAPAPAADDPDTAEFDQPDAPPAAPAGGSGGGGGGTAATMSPPPRQQQQRSDFATPAIDEESDQDSSG